MKLPTYQWFGQMFAATGVIISISLLAYEMKLSRDIAAADVYQQRTAMDISLALSSLPVEKIYAVLEKERRDEALNEEEARLLVIHADIWMFSVENGFYQYRLGLQDEEDLSVLRWQLKRFLATPCYREVFNKSRQGFREDFAAEVDAVLAKTPKVDCILD
jgi:hypothetical protein